MPPHVEVGDARTSKSGARRRRSSASSPRVAHGDLVAALLQPAREESRTYARRRRRRARCALRTFSASSLRAAWTREACCPAPSSLSTVDPAAVLAHDAVGHGQPEPGALADVLGGEERLEDALERALASCPCRRRPPRRRRSRPAAARAVRRRGRCSRSTRDRAPRRRSAGLDGVASPGWSAPAASAPSSTSAYSAARVDVEPHRHALLVGERLEQLTHAWPRRAGRHRAALLARPRGRANSSSWRMIAGHALRPARR